MQSAKQYEVVNFKTKEVVKSGSDYFGLLNYASYLGRQEPGAYYVREKKDENAGGE